MVAQLGAGKLIGDSGKEASTWESVGQSNLTLLPPGSFDWAGVG